MSGFNTYWGDEVPNQGVLVAKYCSLFGESPKKDVILSGRDLYSAVVFDGKAWRELDLLAMQEEAHNLIQNINI